MMGMGFGAVIMLLVWVGVIALVVWGMAALFPRTGRASHAREQDDDAIQTVNRRYARGEINRAEYEQIKAAILEQTR